MPRETIKNLMTEIHEKFGDGITSPQQRLLMEQVQEHIHNMNEAEPPEPGFIETVELFLSEMEEDHPNIASTLSQILEALKNMGV